MIFRHLPIRDKILLERTCSKWQVLLKASWTRFYDLDLSEESWGIQPLYTVDNKIISSVSKDANLMNSILKRCGIYLKSINFNANKMLPCCANLCEFDCSKNCVLQLISEKCVRLTAIDIRICCVDGLNNLAEKCIFLESIKFVGLNYFNATIVNRSLRAIIQKNLNLKSLKLIDVKSVSFLDNVKQELEKLRLSLRMENLLDPHDILTECIKKSHHSLIEFTLEVFSLDFNKLLNVLPLCSNLTKLKIHVEMFVNNYTESQFSKIFLQCRNIEHISIKGLYCDSENSDSGHLTSYGSVHWIHQVNTQILKKLQLEATIVATKFVILKELPIFINLQYLSLNSIMSDDDRKICDSISMCINLVKLQIARCNFLMKTSEGNYFLMHLNKLKDLTVIQYNNCELNENALVNCIGTNLHYLDKLTLGLLNLTDSGIDALTNLKKLRSLSILENENLIGNALYKLSKLQYFKCRECYKIQDESLKLLIKEAKKLEKLIIQHCPNITHEVVKFAIEEKKSGMKDQVVLSIEGNLYDQTINDYKYTYLGIKLDLSYFDESMLSW